MTAQPPLIPRPPRRMKQPRKDVLREQLALAADTIEQQRMQIDSLERTIEVVKWGMGWDKPPRAKSLPWWRRAVRRDW